MQSHVVDELPGAIGTFFSTVCTVRLQVGTFLFIQCLHAVMFTFLLFQVCFQFSFLPYQTFYISITVPTAIAC